MSDVLTDKQIKETRSGKMTCWAETDWLATYDAIKEDRDKLVAFIRDEVQSSGWNVEYADGDCSPCCPLCGGEYGHHEDGCTLKAIISVKR